MLPASVDTVVIDLTFKTFVGFSSFGKFVQLVISPFNFLYSTFLIAGSFQVPVPLLLLD